VEVGWWWKWVGSVFGGRERFSVWLARSMGGELAPIEMPSHTRAGWWRGRHLDGGQKGYGVTHRGFQPQQFAVCGAACGRPSRFRSLSGCALAPRETPRPPRRLPHRPAGVRHRGGASDGEGANPGQRWRRRWMNMCGPEHRRERAGDGW